MSVLIRGMEMPNRCFECIFLTTVPNFFCLAGKRDLCAEHGINISRPDWCPLVEIPTPHGRLIDADKLANETFYGATSAPYITYRKFVNAPTVIEAEGSET